MNKEIRNCKKCSLWKTRKNTVPGEGPVNAEIIILGQSPGAKENQAGKPFIGRAGQSLNKLLKIAGIKREKIFITSILKCLPQPPPNHKPKKEEIEVCSPYLKKQKEQGGQVYGIRVVCNGRPAARYFVTTTTDEGTILRHFLSLLSGKEGEVDVFVNN
ncbi:MAG: hypothetical protein DDT21_02481 [Syntrophomonadaceae bacterium]|nr:hypothetical protein [Bacillota bacterium]